MAHYAAKPFVAGTPEALVIGQVVQAFAENLQADEIAHLLPKHGFANIQSDKWYPHQYWLNILKEISEGPNSNINLIAFGKQVVQNAVLPPELDNIPKVLHALQAIHHAHTQNIPDEEGYRLKQLGENHYYVYHNTPNPDTAIYGFIWGLLARFSGKDETFVIHMLDNPNPTEEPGSIFEVKWGKGQVA